MCNNSALTSMIAMMPMFDAHGLDPTRAEPDVERVQEFFDNLLERAVREETHLIPDTTDEEVAYIASRAEEAPFAEEAGRIGSMEDEANVEEDFATWEEPAGEHSGAGAEGPLVEEVVEETAEEEEPPAKRKKCVLR